MSDFSASKRRPPATGRLRFRITPWVVGLGVVSLLSGSLALDAVTVSAAPASAPTYILLPGFPSAVAVDSATDTIYATSAYPNVMFVVNAKTRKVTAQITLATVPGAVAVDAVTDTIYFVSAPVANRSGTDSVTVINGKTNKVTHTIKVGHGPEGIAVDAATDAVYVANSESDTVSVINGRTNKVTHTVKVGMSPNGVGVDAATDTVYVADAGEQIGLYWYHGGVSVINGKTNKVTRKVPIVYQEPDGLGVDSATDTIYVTDYVSDIISVINGKTDKPSAAIAVGPEPEGVGVDPSTDVVYGVNVGDGGVSDVSVINGKRNKVVVTVKTDSAVAVGVNPSTDDAYVACEYESQTGALMVIHGT